jgi:hypothetical protein
VGTEKRLRHAHRIRATLSGPSTPELIERNERIAHVVIWLFTTRRFDWGRRWLLEWDKNAELLRARWETRKL